MLNRYGPTLDYHPSQYKFWTDQTRFEVVAAGRRSGKTLIAKKKLIRRAVLGPPNSWYVAGAPTFSQGKRIFWTDLVRMTRKFSDRQPSGSELTVYLANGSMISIVGLDAPERLEGANRLQGVIIDECASVKPEAWNEHISPALSDRGLDIPGWAILFGVPEGRNWFFELAEFAQQPANTDWSYHHWPSWEILLPAEIDAARARMDERTFEQEFGASFLDLAGRAYYAFRREVHINPAIAYRPTEPLLFAFDFNVDPYSVLICQQQDLRDVRVYGPEKVLCVLDEVVLSDSNTEAACAVLVSRWKGHSGDTYLFGDASGGARHTSQSDKGTDWNIILTELSTVWPRLPRGSRKLYQRVPKANPPVRSRVNLVNSRFRTSDGLIHVQVHPSCTHAIRDFEGVTRTALGEIDKKADPRLSHLSDAFGYLISMIHGVRKDVAPSANQWMV